MTDKPGEPAPGGNDTAATIETQLADCAIDEDDEVDEEFARMQRTLSLKKSKKHEAPNLLRIQEILPFRARPTILPLLPSHLKSCILVENAAFTNPDHRCSPEKVGGHISS
jgi:hypothetical protein